MDELGNYGFGFQEDETCSEQSYTLSQNFVEGDLNIKQNIQLEWQYNFLKKKFEEEEINSRHDPCILRMSHRLSSLYKWNLNGTKIFIYKCIYFFHLNIIELMYWEKLLELVRESGIVPRDLVIITALHTKHELNKSTKCYEYGLSFLDPPLSIKIDNWLLFNESIGPSSNYLIKEFTNLSKSQECQVNYEEKVTFILNSTKKKQRIEPILKFTDNEQQFDNLEQEDFGIKLSPIHRF